jgi:NAD(P)-dependent dehydrogenase (short-subunit alcohol dehydrogenase family)
LCYSACTSGVYLRFGGKERNMTTRVITPFGAESTAAEVAAEVDLAGKRMIVTGGASGIGIETARALAGRGAEVTIAVRDTEAGARVAADIDGDVRVARLELTDLASVGAFVDAWDGPLDVLVNNAGVMAIQQLELTDSGLETQFATNHLGHFALAVGLHDALAAAEGEARIVSVSSRGHLFSPVVFEDINFERREYTPFGAYGQSKTANVLFAVGATDRWADDGIYANALMPGGIATNLQRHVGADYIARRLEELEKTGQKMTLKTPEQGAATSVLVATSPLLNGIGGRYFEDCNETEVLEPGSEESVAAGVATYALDHENADRLWELSLDLIA